MRSNDTHERGKRERAWFRVYCRSLLQNIVSLIGLFGKRDLSSSSFRVIRGFALKKGEGIVLLGGYN